jgi:hypothetical protein
MVQMLQGWMNVCRWRWAFWTTVDKHNTGKHSKRSRGYLCRSWANYPRCLWDSRTLLRDCSTHFGGQFEHETHFREICAKTAERRPEGPSRFCLQGTQQTRDNPNFISNITTSVETWVYGYDPETSSSHHSGSYQIHRGRKKHIKFSAMSSPCW